MANIRINALTPTTSVAGDSVLPMDGLTTQKIKPIDMLNSIRPFASQAEAEAGAVAGKVLSPLTTAQAVAFQLPSSASGRAMLVAADAATQRGLLALGGAALVNVGTTAGTAAAGDDSRITGAAQKTANLSDLASASTARTNLGLGTSAILDSGILAGNVVALDGLARLPAVDGSQITGIPGALTDGDKGDITVAGSGTVWTVKRGIPTALPQGRLTLISGTPLPTTDVTGAGTIYYVPLSGRYVPIYNGSEFINTDIGGELSNIAANSATGKAGPAAVGANLIYDLFVWDDSGTVRLTRGPAWSSDTVRGTGAGTTEIQFINGIPTNAVSITNGPAANRGTLVGSARSNGSSQFVDTRAFRWVSNIYNAVRRPMVVIDPTATWNYTTTAWRQVRATATNQLDIVQSMSGAMASAMAVLVASSTTAGGFYITAIGVNSAAAPHADASIAPSQIIGSGHTVVNISRLDVALSEGRSTLVWLEYGCPAATAYGASATVLRSAINGSVVN